MTRFVLGLLVFCLCAFLTWSLSLRFFASWADVCFQKGPGWQIGFTDLLGRFRWNSDLFLSSVAPYLPFVGFVGPKQGRTRQVIMLGAMLFTVGVLYLFSGAVKPELCDTKGPFPEIGHLLLGIVFSLPLALGLAWLTQPRHKRVQP